MWREVAVTLFDILFQHLPRVTEKNHRESQPAYSASLTGLEPLIPPVGKFNAGAEPKADAHRCSDVGRVEREPWSILAHRLK
jgi:hypothetical protein